MEVNSIHEKLIFTTVRIETTNKDKSTGTGTGFIVQYNVGDKFYPFLVTNKHVVKNTEIGKFEFNVQLSGKPQLGNKYTIQVSKFEDMWIGHKNPEIDVVIAPIASIINETKKKDIEIFYIPIGLDIIPSNENLDLIDAIEEIIFIGYPNGIYDSKNLLPIVRKGITATPPMIDFNGTPTFLIDASIFPGSSGSPVFICNVGSYTKKGEGLYAGSKLIFLGLVASVFVKQDINTVEVVTIPTKDISIVKTSQMIDLGVVFKSSCIVETIESFLKEIGELK